jgi:hypothetical protein
MTPCDAVATSYFTSRRRKRIWGGERGSERVWSFVAQTEARTKGDHEERISVRDDDEKTISAGGYLPLEVYERRLVPEWEMGLVLAREFERYKLPAEHDE